MTLLLKLSNLATTVLASPINASATSIAVTPGTGALFPALGAGEWFPVVVVAATGDPEIMKVTARSTDTLTVVRGQESSVARSFIAGDRIDLRLTKAAIDAIIDDYTSTKQALDADLTALAALAATAGLLARTGAGAFAVRTVTGTANEIAVANGDGAAGAPTLSLPATLALRAKAVQVQDTNFTVSDNADATKLGAFDAADITAGQTRTLKFPDASGKMALIDVEDQVVAGGASVTSKDLGTKTTGTVTPDPGDRPLQHYINGGAHTLAPGATTGAYVLDVTNNGSAGAITTSGWTKVSGSFTTTNAHKFRCHCSIGNAGSLLVIQALQ